MTEVKICGLRNEQDVIASSKADFNGFVIETGTRRSLSIREAGRLMKLSKVRNVAVTTSTDSLFNANVARELEPYAVQLSGGMKVEGLEELRSRIDCQIWVVVHIGETLPTIDRDALSFADCVVLDTMTPEKGGSGIVHDHELSAKLARQLGARISLAGGLSIDNVMEAIQIVQPSIVDVSSGVESGQTKDASKITHFIDKVRKCH